MNPFRPHRIKEKLNTLERRWPDNLMLFAYSGSLLLVNRDTLEVLESFPGIHCDGGDPRERCEGNKTFLGLKEKRMKASGLIELLKELLDAHGDLQVCLSGDYYPFGEVFDVHFVPANEVTERDFIMIGSLGMIEGT